MRKFFLFLTLIIPLIVYTQKEADSVKSVKNPILKTLIDLAIPEINKAINPAFGQNNYRILPWLHRFLDTASNISIAKFLNETDDSVLQLVGYESLAALHAFTWDNPSSNNDKDGDGIRSFEAGGPDCDDLNFYSFPGNQERCEGFIIFEAWNKKYILINKFQDEDCNPCSVKGADPRDGDEDGDTQICSSCLNYYSSVPYGCPINVSIVPTSSAISLGNPGRVYTINGSDCDDKNPALQKASQICINKTTLAVCKNGKWVYYPCKSCVSQPNGTGVVIE